MTYTEADWQFWFVMWAILCPWVGVFTIVVSWHDGTLDRSEWPFYVIATVFGPLLFLLLPFAMIRFGVPGSKRWRNRSGS